jgi:hypothetical protein
MRVDAPYHIISCASLILRIMMLAKRQQDSTLRVACGNLLARMISTLTAAHHGYSWDVASLALDRIAIIIASVEGELPEVSPLRTTFSQHIQQSAPLRARREFLCQCRSLQAEISGPQHKQKRKIIPLRHR